MLMKDAEVTGPKFSVNSWVYITSQCTLDNPNWLRVAMLRPEDVAEKIPFKVKGVVVKGVNVWYTLERMKIGVQNVPEEYLKVADDIDSKGNYMSKDYPKQEARIGMMVNIETALGVKEHCKIVNVGNHITLMTPGEKTFDVRGDMEFEFVQPNVEIKDEVAQEVIVERVPEVIQVDTMETPIEIKEEVKPKFKAKK